MRTKRGTKWLNGNWILPRLCFEDESASFWGFPSWNDHHGQCHSSQLQLNHLDTETSSFWDVLNPSHMFRFNILQNNPNKWFEKIFRWFSPSPRLREYCRRGGRKEKGVRARGWGTVLWLWHGDGTHELGSCGSLRNNCTRWSQLKCWQRWCTWAAGSTPYWGANGHW